MELNPITEAGVIAVKLDRHDDSNILIGYSIASAKLEDGTKVEIVGSGNTLEFRVLLADERRSREWRCNINKIAELAVELSLREREDELAPAS